MGFFDGLLDFGAGAAQGVAGGLEERKRREERARRLALEEAREARFAEAHSLDQELRRQDLFRRQQEDEREFGRMQVTADTPEPIFPDADVTSAMRLGGEGPGTLMGRGLSTQGPDPFPEFTAPPTPELPRREGVSFDRVGQDPFAGATPFQRYQMQREEEDRIRQENQELEERARFEQARAEATAAHPELAGFLQFAQEPRDITDIFQEDMRQRGQTERTRITRESIEGGRGGKREGAVDFSDVDRALNRVYQMYGQQIDPDDPEAGLELPEGITPEFALRIARGMVTPDPSDDVFPEMAPGSGIGAGRANDEQDAAEPAEFNVGGTFFGNIIDHIMPGNSPREIFRMIQARQPEFEDLALEVLKDPELSDKDKKDILAEIMGR